MNFLHHKPGFAHAYSFCAYVFFKNKRGFSLECEEVSNEDLCFPEQMLKAVSSKIHVLDIISL